jgi:hypothetical protein
MCYFLEARLEVASHARVNSGSDWLPPGEAAVRIGMWVMCPAVYGEKFSPTEKIRVFRMSLYNLFI